ncbi:MAG: hypothetical protein WBP46_19360 [Thiolinea sp.]
MSSFYTTTYLDTYEQRENLINTVFSLINIHGYKFSGRLYQIEFDENNREFIEKQPCFYIKNTNQIKKTTNQDIALLFHSNYGQRIVYFYKNPITQKECLQIADFSATFFHEFSSEEKIQDYCVFLTDIAITIKSDAALLEINEPIKIIDKSYVTEATKTLKSSQENSIILAIIKNSLDIETNNFTKKESKFKSNYAGYDIFFNCDYQNFVT